MEQHRAAFAYDWRARFGAQFSRPGSYTEWVEVYDLTSRLMLDTTSHVFAAVAGWSHPWSQEAAIMAELTDRFTMANTPRKKRSQVQPIPRPWDRDKRKSYKPTVSQAQVRAALRARGH